MKTYYIIKAYASSYVNGQNVERYHYFGKSNKLLGFITESDVKRYSKDDIRDHGYRSYRKALEAGWNLKNMERSEGWTVVITIIAEVA